MRYLLPLALLLASCASPSPYHTERTPQGPYLAITGPRMVIGKLGGPTELLYRFAVKNVECFAIKVFWGDGESSGWDTCDETSWAKPHKYFQHGPMVIEAVLIVDGKVVQRPIYEVDIR